VPTTGLYLGDISETGLPFQTVSFMGAGAGRAPGLAGVRDVQPETKSIHTLSKLKTLKFFMMNESYVGAKPRGNL